MQAIRMRVRTVALVWLLCQAGSLAAFVPENCCLAHFNERAAREKQEACHDAEPPRPEPGDACPMAHADGAACPMHNSKSANCCAMSNACDGPGRHLTTLFAYVATVEQPATTDTVLAATPLVLPSDPPSLHRPTSPDAPPPKA
jgi:hypothetical protein